MSALRGRPGVPSRSPDQHIHLDRLGCHPRHHLCGPQDELHGVHRGQDMLMTIMAAPLSCSASSVTYATNVTPVGIETVPGSFSVAFGALTACTPRPVQTGAWTARQQSEFGAGQCR